MGYNFYHCNPTVPMLVGDDGSSSSTNVECIRLQKCNSFFRTGVIVTVHPIFFCISALNILWLEFYLLLYFTRLICIVKNHDPYIVNTATNPFQIIFSSKAFWNIPVLIAFLNIRKMYTSVTNSFSFNISMVLEYTEMHHREKNELPQLPRDIS